MKNIKTHSLRTIKDDQLCFIIFDAAKTNTQAKVRSMRAVALMKDIRKFLHENWSPISADNLEVFPIKVGTSKK